MNVAQIQIQPVDNGFVVQAVSIDGENYSKKLVAVDLETLRKDLHAIVDQLFVPREKPAKVVAAP